MKKSIWLWGIVLAVLLVACSDGENESEQTQPEEESTEEETTDDEQQNDDNEQNQDEEEQEPEEPAFTYPLTGEEADEQLDRRAFAVMINNHPKARPQTGLTEADIVYEFLAEGYITRLVALYHSEIPERVGPVRSARSYYIDTANAHDAIYVYHGAAQFIENDIQAGWIDNLNGAFHDNDGVLFERSSDRRAPHNSYVFLDNAHNVAQDKGIDVEQSHDELNFRSVNNDEPIEGETAESAKIVYSSNREVSYKYSAEHDGYLRYNDGEQTMEKGSGDPVVLQNVLIYETGHQVIDDVGRREIDIQSGGQGYALQGGKLKEIQWEAVNDVMTPMVDGEPLSLIPGQTWVNVVPESPGLIEAVTYE
ncbi:major membrane immunogen (membrane-anchored lipoprotein) [Alkalibacillus flavidus]|uniref:Major membrane immunogen (Membrane-anchored lipoprotein) n=1 Tax=Alkalibacillus flavidus TaxID=546021 RepID=A0ABV2KUG2_9BACI